MPTFNSAVLPTPKDWNEFEDICLSVSKIRWGNPNFSRFGRQGQKQDGVDIFGNDVLGRLVGIQCKNTLFNLTKAIVDTEIANAESFSPTLAELHIATSASSDVNLQRHILEVSKQRIANGSFGVSILFWSDIEQELSKSKDELTRFYPQFFESHNHSQPRSNYCNRSKDLDRLIELLEYVDIDSTTTYLEMAPKYIYMKFMEQEEPIKKIISSPVFMLYDKELEKVLYSWLSKWFEMINHIRFAPYNYLPNHDQLSFIMPMDICRTKEENDMYENIDEIRKEFFNLQVKFCQYIHEHYPEIDLKQTSLKARKFHSTIW